MCIYKLIFLEISLNEVLQQFFNSDSHFFLPDKAELLPEKMVACKFDF